MTLTFSRFKEIPGKTFQNFVLLFFSFTHVLIPEDIFQEIKFEMRDSFTFHSHDIDPLNMSRHSIILNIILYMGIMSCVEKKSFLQCGASEGLINFLTREMYGSCFTA